MSKVILITGTPGVGKSTTASLLADKIKGRLIPINKVVDDKNLYNGYHQDKNFKIVDLDALCQEMEKIMVEYRDDILIFEGHLSHYIKNADYVIVLRTSPEILGERLRKRGYNSDKIRENMEAEAIDLCAFEAFEIHRNKVNEIDNSEIPPDKVVNMIIQVIEGKKHFKVGNIDFLDFLIKK